MSTQYDHALVLRLSDYSESSQIATLFARQSGLLRLIAKGARRSTKTRFASGLDLLELGEIGFTPGRAGGLGTLTDWTQRSAFAGLRAALAPLHAALYAAECIAALTVEHDPHEALFDALIELLTTLARPAATDASAHALAALNAYDEALAANLGYALQLGGCVDCGKLRAAGRSGWFSAIAGGLLCRDCEGRHPDRRRVSSAALDGADALAAQLERFELFQAHFQRIAERRLSTGDALRRVCSTHL